MDTKQTLIDEAAREVLAHGGPDALTHPHLALAAMSLALDTGATHDDIAAEMRPADGGELMADARHFREDQDPDNPARWTVATGA